MGLPCRGVFVVERVQRGVEPIAIAADSGLAEPSGAIEQTGPVEPVRRDLELPIGDREQEVAANVLEPEAIERSEDRDQSGAIARDFEVCRAKDERLVAFVGPTLEKRRGLRVRPRHDDPGHPHDVELQSGGVQPLDLLLRRHEDLASLMPTLLGTRFLVLDVIAGHTGLDEPTDEVADMPVAAMPGVGVGDDERPEVDHRGRGPLVIGHMNAEEMLVAVGREQGAD